MGKITTLFFLIIFSFIYYYIHRFVYVRIAKGLDLSSENRKYLIIIFIVLAFSFILGEILSKYYGLNIFYAIGSIWIGILSISLTIFIILFLLNMIFSYNFYNKQIMILSLILIIILSLISLYKGLKYPIIKKITIYYNNLPTQLENFKIIQLSDLHLGNYNSKKRLDKIIKITNGLKPDIVVITGDIIDKDICKIEKICNPFLKLKTKYGVFAVSGNHEFYSNYKIFLDFSLKNNIKVLRNQKVKINETLEIAGIDDGEHNRFSENFKKQNINVLFKTFSNKRFTVFLSHRPIRFKMAVLKGVNLQLSGHTHRGQIPPMDLLVYLIYKYSYGLHKYKNGFIYTTSGTNTWGPPMRLFSNNEIVKITLKKEK